MPLGDSQDHLLNKLAETTYSKSLKCQCESDFSQKIMKFLCRYSEISRLLLQILPITHISNISKSSRAAGQPNVLFAHCRQQEFVH
jgi:hypothetical protein